MKFSSKTPALVFFFLFIFIQSTISQTSCTSCSVTSCDQITVSYSYNGNIVNYPNIPWVKGMNVRVAMLNSQQLYGYSFTTKAYCPFGGYLVSFNGIYSGNSTYWQLQVNGVAVRQGMDFQQLKPNDRVTWVLTPYVATETKKTDSHQLIMAKMHVKNIH